MASRAAKRRAKKRRRLKPPVAAPPGPDRDGGAPKPEAWEAAASTLDPSDARGWAAVMARANRSEEKKERRKRAKERPFTDARVDPRVLRAGWLAARDGVSVKDMAPTDNHIAVWRGAVADLLGGRRVRPTPGAGSAHGGRKGGGGASC
jgi:hypothetical protein